MGLRDALMNWRPPYRTLHFVCNVRNPSAGTMLLLQHLWKVWQTQMRKLVRSRKIFCYRAANPDSGVHSAYHPHTECKMARPARDDTSVFA